MIPGLPAPFNPTHANSDKKNSNGHSNRKTKIYALLRNVLRPVVAASPAGVGARLLVAAAAGFLTVVEGTWLRTVVFLAAGFDVEDVLVALRAPVPALVGLTTVVPEDALDETLFFRSR